MSLQNLLPNLRLCEFPCSIETHELSRKAQSTTHRSPFVSMAISSAGASDFTIRQYEKNDGILIVDHGSRRPQSNAMIHSFVDLFKQKTGHPNVEPAHMELASPTIKEAFDKCISQGASRVIIAPYFLSPGRHWDKDIPALAAEAAKQHQNVSYIVTAPIGLHDLMVDILQDRISNCLRHAAGEIPECEMCLGTGRCRVVQSLSSSEKATQS
ncbi:hypothetical protein KP509_10G032900 [Ceratopteris richardii]|uniref:Sirohydrochlorin ferrochelatase n=1 Tax=Ceratopteris richardii TaxID=49495 RepID=A0A8T2TU45_CERRI|nr:hypothetical protein KP509_10G032900 [Ceratopteris richardii]